MSLQLHARLIFSLVILPSCGSCSPKGSAGPTAQASSPRKAVPANPKPAGTWSKNSLALKLYRVQDGAKVVSFGVPLPRGAVVDPSAVTVRVGGKDAGARVHEILADHDGTGARVGARALLVQFSAAEIAGDSAEVELSWAGRDKAAPSGDVTPYGSDAISFASPVIAKVTERTIVKGALQEGPVVEKQVYAGREPRFLAVFPEGYLAATGILGELVTAREARSREQGGLAFFSKAIEEFGLATMHETGYPLHPEAVADAQGDYEQWLYDPCTTYLIAHAHLGDVRFLRHALKTCSYYLGKIETTGPRAGTFSGKSGADPKYSHLRGAYAYYALTGDETALEAARAVARMWEAEPFFVDHYRKGKTRGHDKLWTERLLGASLEGLWYGFRFTGNKDYLTAFKEVFDTAFRHVSGGQDVLGLINPGVKFPPQNCFIHNALQQSEGEASRPWCSPWMSVLLADSLLRYQEISGDPRVDEVFVRLSRYLRDVGTTYFVRDVLGDTFLSPTACDDTRRGPRRRLVAFYGAALDEKGARHQVGGWDDLEHCADVTALTAAALRALKRRGEYDKNPIGPFKSEGESILQLHHELASCAERHFQYHVREKRDPRTWTSRELEEGASNPLEFIAKKRIGFPSHNVSPLRKLSWWFNTSLLQFGLLKEAQVFVPTLEPGRVQAPGCR
ncbi:MAG: hypothetical protein HY698_01980 [Deltaproteobacteria bacterium]|nr:hypothetical protein [Deltaproteobacteria bacterium]